MEAVSSALFGSDSPDDSQADRPFFSDCSPDDNDPMDLFLDDVIERRSGLSLSLSLIAADACSALGVPMVGLNSPQHVLVAPADSSPFLLDCAGGGVLRDDDAAQLLAERLGREANDEEALAYGQTALRALRAAPMTPLQWAARVLRNLRAIYTLNGDVVKLLGACDRLRQIAAHSRLAVSDQEMRECSAQLALCIWALRCEQRRDEARALLQGLLRYEREAAERFGDSFGDLDAVERGRLEQLLAEPWFEQ